MENWLCIDLGNTPGSFALMKSSEDELPTLLSEVVLEGPQRQSETFLPLLVQELKNQGLELKQINRVILNRGPGSYTGLRVAFASVFGFLAALEASIETLDGSEALALNWIQKNPTVKFSHLMQVSSLRWRHVEFILEDKNLKIAQDEVLEASNAKTFSELVLLTQNQTPESFKIKERDCLQPKASHLGFALKYSTTRKSYVDGIKRFLAEPDYYGSSIKPS